MPERLNKPYMNSQALKEHLDGWGALIDDDAHLLKEVWDENAAIMEPVITLSRDTETVTYTETVGELVFVDYIPPVGKKPAMCRVGEKLSIPGQYVAPSQHTLHGRTRLALAQHVKRTVKHPFSTGPLIAFSYESHNGIGDTTTSVLDLDTNEILMGRESRQKGYLIKQPLLPRAFFLNGSGSAAQQRVVMEVGKHFNYRHVDFDPNVKSNTNGFDFSTYSPISEILICSPLIPFDLNQHPWIARLLASGNPLALDPAFARFKGDIVQGISVKDRDDRRKEIEVATQDNTAALQKEQAQIQRANRIQTVLDTMSINPAWKK